MASVIIWAFSATSRSTRHPDVSVRVPPPFKMISGGARANWKTQGALLTACFPENNCTWRAMSKDHDIPEETTLDVFALGLFDDKNLYEVRITQSSSVPESHPKATAPLPQGFALCGGGAFTDWSEKDGAGSLLTASRPSDNGLGWFAASKDHMVSDPCVITAFAIGIRPKDSTTPPIQTTLKTQDSKKKAYPSVAISVEPGFSMLGGGAWDMWEADPGSAGNLLTGLFPSGGVPLTADEVRQQVSHNQVEFDNPPALVDPDTWTVSGKDHEVSDPAVIRAFLLMIKNPF